MNGSNSIGPIRKVLMYVLGYLALIVVAVFSDISRHKGLK